VGLAFAQKYKNKDNISVVYFGDGAANQGQVFESYNMAYLLKSPVVFVVENNLYGMGTSVDRSSMNIEFFKRGDVIPGIQVLLSFFLQV